MDEGNLQEIIKQAQQVLYCPTCGRTYQLDEIRLRGYLDDTLILQTMCSNQHQPVLTLYLTNSVKAGQGAEREAQVVNATPEPAAARRLNKDDVLDLHLRLKKFDGNFRNLWNKP